MILSNRKGMFDDSRRVKLSHRIRTWFWDFAHDLIQNQVFSNFVYQLLLIIEFFQFIWFAIHPSFSFLWNINVVDWFREFLRFLQIDGFLAYGKSNNSKIFLIFLYLVFTVEVFMFSLFVFNIWFKSTKRPQSTLVIYSIKVFAGFIVLLKSIFTIPFYYIHMAAFICRDDDPIHKGMQCFKGVYFVHFIIALIGLLLVLPLTIFGKLFTIDLNPWSSLPFAAPHSRLSLLKLLIKVALPIYFIVDYEAKVSKEFLVFYGVFWLGMLVLRYRQIPLYNSSIFKLILVLEVSLFWTILVSLIHAFVDKTPTDNIGFLYLALGAGFVAFTFSTIVNRRRKVYLKVLVKHLKKATDVEMYIVNIISLIEDRNNVRKRMALDGLLRYHTKSCTRKEIDCVCQSLYCDFLKDTEPPEKMWYMWVKAITLDALERFPKSSRLHMLYGFVQKEKLHNKFKALFEIMFAYENKPTIEEEFSIHRYKSLIEDEMIESDNKTVEEKGLNVNIIVEFENKFVDFQAAIGNAVDLHLDFWRELLENSPEIQKLQSLGSLITKSVEETAKHFQSLSSINPNQVKMLRIYGNFLKDVVYDEAEAQKIIERADYNERAFTANRQFMDEARLKYGENSNTCIITVSGNFNDLGIITNTNNEVTRLLGYTKGDLVGQNIICIMPRFLWEVHNGFMSNYFESSDAKVIAIERVVFPLHKSGYVIPCTLMAKVLPNLDDGLKLVGFIGELDKDLTVSQMQELENAGEDEEAHYILYDGNTGILHGITQGCKREFGIPYSLAQGNEGNNEFTIEHIFPELPQINLDDMKASGHLVTVLNTTSLGQDYVDDKDEEDSDYSGREEDKDRRFRKTRVKISLFQDSQYGDVSLKVLKFSEVKGEGEQDGERVQSRQALADERTPKPGHTAAKFQLRENKSIDDAGGSQLDQAGSEAESNMNEVNDQIRELKEFKSMISEKTVPKSIRILRNAALVMSLLLLGLASLTLGFSSNVSNEFNDGVAVVADGYIRHNIMASINYKLRKLQLLATNITQPATTEAADLLEKQLRHAEVDLIDQLRTITLQIGNNQDLLESKGFPSIESDNVAIQSLVQSGPKLERRYFSDAMSQYTSHATSASNAPLSSFTSLDVTDSTRASFYYVRRNGLGQLRAKSEENAEKFSEFYSKRTGKLELRFKIIMIVTIVLVVVSELILIPIVFSVHKTATKVLSLFGYIPLADISQLATKCQQYMLKYLDNHKSTDEYFADEDDEDDYASHKVKTVNDQVYTEVNQGPNEDENPEANASYFVEMSRDYSNVAASGLQVPETQNMKPVASQLSGISNVNMMKSMETEGRGFMDLTTKQLKHDQSGVVSPSRSPHQPRRSIQGGIAIKEEAKKGQVQDNDEDADIVNDRTQKLLNSRDNKRVTVIVQFCMVGLLFIMYSVVDYFLHKDSLSKIGMAVKHLELMSQRMPNVRFLNAFTLEIISEVDSAKVYSYPDIGWVDYRAKYHDLVYSSNNELKDSVRMDFPGQFDEYISLFSLYDGGNLCTQYYTESVSKQIKCSQVAGGLLTNGLTLSITRIAQLSDDLINDFNATAMGKPGQKEVINGIGFAEIEDLVDLIAPIDNTLRAKFMEAFSTYVEHNWNVERGIFGAFLALVIVIYVIVWVPYLRSLKEKIFRTKGMLNMIPMELITRNAALRNLFVNSADILQAVK